MDARQPAACAAGAPARRRVTALRLLAGLVLAGLWLMHGVSATTASGCHGVPVLMMSVNFPAADSGTPPLGFTEARIAAPEQGPRFARVSPAGNSGSMRTGSGETCLSGQPPSPGDLLLGLLICLALLVFVRALILIELLAHPPASALPLLRRGGPPGQVGRELLTTVCVSRT